MNLFRTLRRGLSITVLAVVFLFSVAACGGEATPTPAPDIELGELLSSAGEKLAAMSTMKFNMVDEEETGAKFFGTIFKSMETEVRAPDSFRMVVDVEAPGFGFVEIEMLAVGDQAYMKLSKGRSVEPLARRPGAFQFRGVGPDSARSADHHQGRRHRHRPGVRSGHPEHSR